MIVFTVIIGIIVSAILIIHTFLTSNIIEKEGEQLRDGLDKYYSKNEIDEEM